MFRVNDIHYPTVRVCLCYLVLFLLFTRTRRYVCGHTLKSALSGDEAMASVFPSRASKIPSYQAVLVSGNCFCNFLYNFATAFLGTRAHFRRAPLDIFRNTCWVGILFLWRKNWRRGLFPFAGACPPMGHPAARLPRAKALVRASPLT